MLLGIPGDNTYANYQEANRAFYRLTVLPLVARTAKELSAWLAGPFGEGLRLWYDADRIEGLSSERDALWTWWEKQKNAAKAEGRRRLAIINEVIAEQQDGQPRMQVLQAVLAQHDVSPSTFYEWEDRIKGRHRGVWLPLLTPRRRGGVVSADCSAEAWDFISSAWLSPHSTVDVVYITRLVATSTPFATSIIALTLRPALAAAR